LLVVEAVVHLLVVVEVQEVIFVFQALLYVDLLLLQ
jgi:hypothetical protein